MSARWIGIVCLFLGFAPAALAQQTKDPLRFVPSQAEWVLKVDGPADVVHAVESNEHFLQAKKLAPIRELYESTNYHRVYQLLAYFEKQLGMSRDEMLAELSGGGLVAAAKFSEPQGAMLVLQSKDEKKLRRFVDLGLQVLEKELERQESKDRIVRKKYQGYDVGQIGPKLNFAVVDGALLLANSDTALHFVLDVYHDKTGQTIQEVPNFIAARKMAPPQALAWTWFHLEEIRKIPMFKDGLMAASLDTNVTIVFGGIADLIKRSPYVSGALTHTRTRSGGDYRLQVFMPRGREGMPAISHMILPADGKGVLPLLQPPRTIASSSYFLDLGEFWDRRVAILGEKNGKALGDGEKNITKFLGGITLNKLFHDLGPYQRFVSVQPKETGYKIKPGLPLQAYALVLSMRDPSFAKDMNGILRSAALLGTFKFGLSLKEETFQDCAMVSYYFSETKKVDGDPERVRFNFSPTYVTVGDQFVLSSTAELARDLITAIKAEQGHKPIKATMRTQIYASGISDILRVNQDTILTQFMLNRALAPKTAQQELQAILDMIDRLGTLRLETHYGANEFRYDVLWQSWK